MDGQSPEECSWNAEVLLDKGWPGEASPGSQKPRGAEACVCLQPGLGRCRGLGANTAQMASSLRDQRQLGTEGEILANHQPNEQLWINKGSGERKERKGNRQLPVKNL